MSDEKAQSSPVRSFRRVVVNILEHGIFVNTATKRKLLDILSRTWDAFPGGELYANKTSAARAQCLKTDIFPPAPEIISTSDFIASYRYHPPDPDASIINSLPPAIWIRIFKHLPYRSQLEAAKVCKDFRDATRFVVHQRPVDLHLIQPHPIHPICPLEIFHKSLIIDSQEQVSRLSHCDIQALVLFVTYLGMDPPEQIQPSVGDTFEQLAEIDGLAPVDRCFQNIGLFQSLSSLDITGLYLTPFHIQQIFLLSSLRRLTLTHCTAEETVLDMVPSSPTLSIVRAYSLEDALTILPFCHPDGLRELALNSTDGDELFTKLSATGSWPLLKTVFTSPDRVTQNVLVSFQRLCPPDCIIQNL